MGRQEWQVDENRSNSRRSIMRLLMVLIVMVIGAVASFGWMRYVEHRATAELDSFGQVMTPEADTLDEVVDLYGGVPAYSRAVGTWLLAEYGWTTSDGRAERSMPANVDTLPFALGSSVFLVDDKANVVAKWYNAGQGDVRHLSSFNMPLDLAAVTEQKIEDLLPQTEATAEVIGPPLEFSMEDQDQVVHTQEEFLGTPLLIMSSDKAGSGYSKQWSKAIYEGMDARGVERLRIVPVPQLGGVPEFARGMARTMVKKDLGEMFALLDWKSAFTERYGLADGHANYLLFDAEGTLLRKESVQELDEALAAELTDEVVAAIRAHAAEAGI